MSTTLVLVTVAVGLGTWLFRFLPTKLELAKDGSDSLLNRFFGSTGPAAIATMFVVSIVPTLRDDVATILPTLCATAAIAISFFWRRSVAIATLVGAGVYGVTFGLLG
jgi:branched-subunit amino acid transport protein AzlD